MPQRQPQPQQSRSECGACGAPVANGLGLCRADERAVLTALDTLSGWLLADLEITRTRQDRVGTPGRRAPGFATSAPLTWNDHAAGVADVAHATILAWAAECHRPDEDDPLAALDPSDVAGLARWLRRAMPVLRTHPEAGLAHSQLTAVVARARRAVDLPRTSSAFTVGPCPERLDGPGPVPTACSGTVLAVIGATEDAPSVMRCDCCGRVWGTAEWLRAGRRILARMRELGLTSTNPGMAACA